MASSNVSVEVRRMLMLSLLAMIDVGLASRALAGMLRQSPVYSGSLFTWEFIRVARLDRPDLV